MVTGTQFFRNDSLGYFLTPETWTQALDLIEFQVSQINKNRHYNKLSTFSYKNKSHESRQALRDAEYFKSRVANNLFYGLEKEFRSIPYLLPKAGGSRRNTKYISYPLLAVHNAIGIYLLELTKLFREHSKEEYSWYGADLDNFFASTKPHKRAQALFYMPFYKRYQTTLHAQQRIRGYEHRAAIYFDIKDFFDELPVSILLELIDNYVGNDIKARFRFDRDSRYEIERFYLYLQGGNGVPQHELNTVSSFTSNLYLQFANMKMKDIVSSYGNLIAENKIIQYVYDTWLFVDFAPWVAQKSRDQVITEIFERIVDELLDTYKLRLSNKTKVFYLNDNEDRTAMAGQITMTSLEYGSVDETGESTSTPIELFQDICEAIKGLSKRRSYQAAMSSLEHETEVFNHVYKKGVAELLNHETYLFELEGAFLGFDFALIKSAPLSLTILISKVEAVWSQFRHYLLEKQHYSSHDIIIAIHFLSQVNFEDSEVLEKICQNPLGRVLVEDFRLTSIPSRNPGYFNMSCIHTLIIRDEHDIIRQIERRVLAEKRRDFSVAMNHLVNELEAVCLAFDPNKPSSVKKYNQKNVKQFAQSCGALTSDLNMLPNIYSGRHSNSVSHPGSLQEPIQTVSETGYNRHKTIIGRLIAKILETEHQIISDVSPVIVLPAATVE